MQMTCINKTQFRELSDKRFFFHDGIVSLPFGNFLLNKVRKKKNIKRKYSMKYKAKKYDFFKEEAANVRQCERLCILR